MLFTLKLLSLFLGTPKLISISEASLCVNLLNCAFLLDIFVPVWFSLTLPKLLLKLTLEWLLNLRVDNGNVIPPSIIIRKCLVKKPIRKMVLENTFYSIETYELGSQ